MTRVTSIASACVAALLLTLPTSVGAQDSNTQERTFLTFSNTVELPGLTLPAGTYTFRLADTQSRNVVQVLSQDERQVHGQFLFIPTERRDVSGDTVITFRETREGATPAIQYWYYPGEKIGKEFIYPKEQAMKIAARTSSTVMTADGPVSANSTASSINSTGEVTAWQRERTTTSPAEATVAGATGVANTRAAEASAADTLMAQAAPAAAAPAPSDNVAVGTSGVQNTQPESTQARAELPRTASPLMLSGLLGLLSLAGVAGLRMFRD